MLGMHRLVERNYVRRNVYCCAGCGAKTVQCRYCKNMARTSAMWDDELCSEHDGSIASFKNLNLKIDDLADFEKLFERDSVNLLRIGKIAAGTVAGVTVFAPLAVLAAPAVASSLGAAGLLWGGRYGNRYQFVERRGPDQRIASSRRRRHDAGRRRGHDGSGRGAWGVPGWHDQQ
jgi:hypothetical protein